MAVREILTWPHPGLTQRTTDLPSAEEVGQVRLDLVQTMLRHDALGLAAPQVGLPYRCFVICTGRRSGMLVVNPSILAASEELTVDQERCLSLPGVVADVARPRWIVVRCRLQDGSLYSQRLTGTPARVFQHETDHCDGKLLTDRVSTKQRKLIMVYLRMKESVA